jgi:hypothetical protein
MLTSRRHGFSLGWNVFMFIRVTFSEVWKNVTVLLKF